MSPERILWNRLAVRVPIISLVRETGGSLSSCYQKQSCSGLFESQRFCIGGKGWQGINEILSLAFSAEDTRSSVF